MSGLRWSFLEILPSEHRKINVLTSSRDNPSVQSREIFKERKYIWKKLSDEFHRFS